MTITFRPSSFANTDKAFQASSINSQKAAPRFGGIFDDNPVSNDGTADVNCNWDTGALYIFNRAAAKNLQAIIDKVTIAKTTAAPISSDQLFNYFRTSFVESCFSFLAHDAVFQRGLLDAGINPDQLKNFKRLANQTRTIPASRWENKVFPKPVLWLAFMGAMLKSNDNAIKQFIHLPENLSLELFNAEQDLKTTILNYTQLAGQSNRASTSDVIRGLLLSPVFGDTAVKVMQNMFGITNKKQMDGFKARFFEVKPFMQPGLVLGSRTMLPATDAFSETTSPTEQQRIGSRKDLLNLESRIHEQFIGQEDAVKQVSQAIRRRQAGIRDSKKPLGRFFFVGPTGVGKTELAKQVARIMTGSENNVVVFNMHDYKESHSVARLFGAPPGYIGHDEGGQLTESIRRNPNTVLLFDEIEKAHPDVWNALLTLLDEGYVKDAKGQTFDAKNTMVIMTSNAGATKAEEIKNHKAIGFKQPDDKEKDASAGQIQVQTIKDRFPPEFLNRLDDVILFKELTKDEKTRITHLHVNKFKKELLENRGITLKLQPKAIEFLVEQLFPGPEIASHFERRGGRQVEAMITEHVENAIANLVLSREEQGPARITGKLNSKGDGLEFQIEPIAKKLDTVA